jgi:phage shock protein C
MENRVSTNRLYKSREHKMIAGVAGGLAQYFNADPTLVRLAMVAGFLIPPLGGIVFLGYIILAVVVPERPLGEEEPAVAASSIDTSRAREIGGFLLLGLGALLLAGNMGLFHLFDWFSWRLFWPLALIGFGALLLMRRRD